MLFLVDAVSFLVYSGRDGRARARAGDGAPALGERSGSYRDVLRHRPFLAVVSLNALFIFAGYSGFDVLPVYAKNEAGLSETSIGLLFLVNTAVIIFAQLPIAGLSRGRRRMPTLALFGLLWAGAWLLVPIAGAAGGQAAFLLLVVVMAVFAIGMCLHGAVAAPLVADLAQPHVARPVHGAERALVAGRVRARAGARRRRARVVAERRLARRLGAVRDRRGTRARRRGPAAARVRGERPPPTAPASA